MRRVGINNGSSANVRQACRRQCSGRSQNRRARHNSVAVPRNRRQDPARRLLLLSPGSITGSQIGSVEDVSAHRSCCRASTFPKRQAIGNAAVQRRRRHLMRAERCRRSSTSDCSTDSNCKPGPQGPRRQRTSGHRTTEARKDRRQASAAGSAEERSGSHRRCPGRPTLGRRENRPP